VAALEGPVAGLAALEAVDLDAVRDFQPFHACRADLLHQAGRDAEALDAYHRAIELTANPSERRFLETRVQAVARSTATP
jgi:RNA polymerase sigma-70 factor, ECF subfamily